MKNFENEMKNLLSKTLENFSSSAEFEPTDIHTLSKAIRDIESIQNMNVKPYLIKWDLNIWFPIFDYIINALELLGYEYIGSMDSTTGYIFENENNFSHEILFRFKNLNCDYSKTIIK